MYYIKRLPDGNLTETLPYERFDEAKQQADELCNRSGRKVHYAVVKVIDAYYTKTLDEAINE